MNLSVNMSERSWAAWMGVAAAAVLGTMAPSAMGQVTINSASRVMGVSSQFGNASDSFTGPGPWDRTLTVVAGTTTLNSLVSATEINANFSFTVGNPPPGALPGVVLQYQVTMTISAPVALTLSRSASGPVSENFSFSGPGIVIGSGTSPGTFLVTPGDYLLQYSVNGFAPGVGSTAFNVTLSPVPIAPTAFTYQGKLTAGTGGVPSAIDVSATVWSAQTGGTAVTGPMAANAVTVAADGTFTTVLDPGIDLPMSSTWLELAVRPSGSGAYTTLSPRQAIRATPKARTAAVAETAQTALGLDAQQRVILRGEPGASPASPGLWLNSGNVFRAFFGMQDNQRVGWFVPSTGWSVVLNSTTGFLGVGTDQPNYNLHTSGPTDTQVAISSTSSGGRTWSLQSSAGTYGTGNQLNGSLQIIDRTAGLLRMMVDANGNVGVGTATPQAKLQVAGGGVRADSYQFNAPVASSITIGDTAWRARTGGAVTYGLGQGGAQLPVGDTFGAMTELRLPVGATLTGVTVYVVDNESASNINAELQSWNPAALSGYVGLSIPVQSSGANAGVQALAANPGTPITINAGQVYLLRVAPTNGGWTGNMLIRGAVVNYTMTAPAR